MGFKTHDDSRFQAVAQSPRCTKSSASLSASTECSCVFIMCLRYRPENCTSFVGYMIRARSLERELGKEKSTNVKLSSELEKSRQQLEDLSSQHQKLQLQARGKRLVSSDSAVVCPVTCVRLTQRNSQDGRLMGSSPNDLFRRRVVYWRRAFRTTCVSETDACSWPMSTGRRVRCVDVRK